MLAQRVSREASMENAMTVTLTDEQAMNR